MKTITTKNLLSLGISVILSVGAAPSVMSMEDGLAPPGTHPKSAPPKSQKSTKPSDPTGGVTDDQALGGHKQESLRPPPTPNGLVNPCQMADSPKWCDGQ